MEWRGEQKRRKGHPQEGAGGSWLAEVRAVVIGDRGDLSNLLPGVLQAQDSPKRLFRILWNKITGGQHMTWDVIQPCLHAKFLKRSACRAHVT